MNQHHSSPSDSIDELLPLLADQHCRATLSYFQDTATETTSVRDLADEITKEDHGGTDETVLTLHHRTLPRLAETRVIEYDSRSRTIRFYGHPKLEPLLKTVTAANIES